MKSIVNSLAYGFHYFDFFGSVCEYKSAVSPYTQQYANERNLGTTFEMFSYI